MSTAAATAVAPALSLHSRDGHFLLGELPQFRQHPLARVQTWARQYSPIARVRLGYSTRYVLTHPDYVQHVLQTNSRNYIKEQQLAKLIRLTIGNGVDTIFTSEDDGWLRLHRAMQPVFHHQQVNRFIKLINDQTTLLLAQWQKMASSGQWLNVESSLDELTLSIISHSMFSIDIDADVARLKEAFAVTSDFVASRASASFALPLFIPTPQHLRVQRALRTIKRTFSEIIQTRRQRGGDYHDLLDALLMSRDETTGRGLTHAEMIAEMAGIVFAGHKTTSTTLTWVLYLLAKHPEIAQRVATEVDAVAADRPLTIDDLQRMTYTTQVIQETMRLYPAVWTTAREAVDDDRINGYRIPARAKLHLNIYGLHRHPEYWQEPERFNPDRFNPADVAGRPPFVYLPFGGGPRKCLGEMFAMTETQVILTRIMQHYRLCLAADDKIAPQAGFLLRPLTAS